jgi:hypothetical protein
MSEEKVSRLGGYAGILAGALWMLVVLLELAGTGLLSDGDVMHYLMIVLALLVLFAGVTLYFQGQRSRNEKFAIFFLAAGAAALIVSGILYAIQFDPEDGSAFMSYFINTVLQGLGLAAFGFTLRSRSGFTGMSKALTVLGIALAISFPAAYLVENLAGSYLSDSVSGVIWLSIMVLEALSWLVLGWTVLTVGKETEIQPAGSAG